MTAAVPSVPGVRPLAARVPLTALGPARVVGLDVPVPGAAAREGLLGLALIALALAFEYSGLDRVPVDAAYDTGLGRWTYGDAWWTNQLLHDGGRWLIEGIAVAMALLVATSYLLPRLRPARRAGAYLLLTIALAAGGVGVAKRYTGVDCPWSLARYGGDRPYVHLLADRPDDLPPARCFPGGHSSGGFALLALYFIAVGCGWRRPRLYALPGALTGTLFAADQWLRGAHFPSHDIWSAAIGWLIASALFHWAFRGRLGRPAASRRR